MKDLINELKKHSDEKRAKSESRYFKTGKGEYGEGRISIGVKTETKRKLAKKYKNLSLNDISNLLHSGISDHQSVALRILTEKYKHSKKDEKKKKEIFDFYLSNLKGINNWDLVDLSCWKILGDFLLNQEDKNILYDLAKSNDLWKKRIAIVSTYAFIRENDLEDTMKLSKILLKDEHDLMHKAVGWMLREVGKKDIEQLKKFLKENYNDLPRTTLRYAIERFPEGLRKKFLVGDI